MIAHVDEFLIDTRIAARPGSNAAALLRHLNEEVLKLPQARSAAYASAELMRSIGIGATVVPQGVVLPKKTFLNTSLNYVTPDYFETLGIPLLAGRTVDVRDLKAKPKPIVVNRAFADFFFPNQNPIGKAIVQGIDGTKPPTPIIVAGTAKYRTMREPDTPTFYQVADASRRMFCMSARMTIRQQLSAQFTSSFMISILVSWCSQLTRSNRTCRARYGKSV